MRPATLLPVLMLAACGLVGGPAVAAKADRTRPLVFDAGGGGQMNTNLKGFIELLGPSVVVSQGSMLVRAARITAAQQADQTLRVVAEGGEGLPAVRFSQDLDTPGQRIEAESQRVEFDEASGQARLIGTARLRRWNGGQLEDDVSGEHIVYDTRKESVSVLGKGGQAARGGTGQAGEGSVRIVIMPKAAADGAGGPGGAAAPASAPALQVAPALTPKPTPR